MKHAWIARIFLTAISVWLTAISVLADDKADFFELRIRPVLAKNCFSCHLSSRMGGLSMESRDTLLNGGQSGPALVPGDPENSLIAQAVRYTHPKLRMPPSGKLTETEI